MMKNDGILRCELNSFTSSEDNIPLHRSPVRRTRRDVGKKSFVDGSHKLLTFVSPAFSGFCFQRDGK